MEVGEELKEREGGEGGGSGKRCKRRKAVSTSPYHQLHIMNCRSAGHRATNEQCTDTCSVHIHSH